MSNRILVPLVVFLILHGLVHFLGTAVYMRLGEPPGFVYKTTVLAGHLDLGATGIWVYGFLWLLAGAGTMVAAAALLRGAAWATPLLMISTMLSLAIAVLDWELAKAGAIVDVVLLAALLLSLRLPALGF